MRFYGFVVVVFIAAFAAVYFTPRAFPTGQLGSPSAQRGFSTGQPVFSEMPVSPDAPVFVGPRDWKNDKR